MPIRPRITFYVPRPERPAGDLPSTSAAFWPWVLRQKLRETVGRFAWTLLTYLHLRDAGFACHLADALPPGGIVVAHRTFLGDRIRPGPNLLLVCLLADMEAPKWWGTGRHPYAQLHVAQNPQDPSLTRPDPLWETHYLPFWPMPGLMPRDAARGDRFEHAAFFGNDLAPELNTPDWVARLGRLGLRWEVVPLERWHDFREIDVVVAVRRFDARDRDFLYKPATKLYNAWLAGVPAVLGREAAYRFERRSELDYLEVGSVDDAQRALQRLRDDVGLRRAIVDNGKMRAQEVTPSRLTARWQDFLTGAATDAYGRWCAMTPSAQRAFLARRFVAAYGREAVMRRGRSWLAKRESALRGLGSRLLKRRP